MRSITNLFAAFANLAASINALASVVDVASGRLRQQLALDGETDTPALPHNAEVLDGSTDPAPAARRNGRAKVNA